ncbi:MAG: hypothetical protein ACXVSX_03270 [Solirubrobacteraceae bacterium]
MRHRYAAVDESPPLANVIGGVPGSTCWSAGEVIAGRPGGVTSAKPAVTALSASITGLQVPVPEQAPLQPVKE